MIKCEQITKGINSCDNCERIMPLILRYEITRLFVLDLCEDCSNAMANLHYKVMEQGKPHKYDMDEITEVTE